MPGRITTFRWLLLMAAFMLADDQGRLSASYVPPICEEVCSTSTECSEVCYLNLMEYENGNDITCLEYGTYDIETCRTAATGSVRILVQKTVTLVRRTVRWA